MRTHVALSSAGGLLLGAAIVLWFSSVQGSFWGNTFFELPYPFAFVSVPIAATVSAALASWLISGASTWRHRGFVVRGLAIGIVAFSLYAAAHTVGYFGFALLRGIEPSDALTGGLWFSLAIILFGGMFFIPLCCAMGVLCEWLAKRIAA